VVGDRKPFKLDFIDPVNGGERSVTAIDLSPTTRLSISADGLLIAYGSDNRIAIVSQHPTEPILQSVQSDTKKHFTSVAFHPSGRFLAATSNDTTVKLYDTETWTVAKTFTWNVGRLRSVAFSPDGLLAAAGSDTGKVVVWDVDV
jgi:WD40 repeat protein